MDIEALLGLQQAYHDLSRAFEAARTFTALRAWAEGELFAQLQTLGAELRRATRGAATSSEIESLARALQEATALAEERVSAVRTSADYRSALSAYEQERWADLEQLLPKVFADLSPAPRPARVFVPFEPSRPRRRPGQPPFLSAAESAEVLASLVTSGMPPDPESGPWWSRDFPHLVATDDPEALASSIWVVFDGPRIEAAVLADRSTPQAWRVYTKCLRGAVGVGIAASVEDEWWEAHDVPFSEYREALRSALAARGISVGTP